MTITDSISHICSSLGSIFETDQREVIKNILKADKVVFLDTCFVTKSHNINTENVLEAFERLACSKDKQTIVFVVTELVLYELKDSASDELQAKNKLFFEKMSEYGFCLLILKEESVCDNIRPFMSYSNRKWNEVFSRLIHENVANFSFNQLVKTDSRMPYFGFSEAGYSVPDDINFIGDIILYLKNAKRNKDSMAEELICTSLFLILELTRGSMYKEYIFCSHDHKAVVRMNKAMQTSYSSVQKQLKSINVFGLIQFMINEKILTSKIDIIEMLKKIMGDNVKLVIFDASPFTSMEKTVSIEDAVDRIFNGEHVEFIGRVS